jgi:hypothetical protein
VIRDRQLESENSSSVNPWAAMEKVSPRRPPADAMIDSVPASSIAASRTSSAGTPGACAPETVLAADNDTDAGEGATIAMWCPPIDWRDLEISVAPARPGLSPPPAAAPARERVEIPWANRRMSDRLQARRGSRAEVRRWGGEGNPNIAEELLNVSEFGVGVRLSAPVRRGERFDVTLWSPGAEWCGRGLGVVRWVVVFGGGTVLAGLQLSRPLTAKALTELTAEPTAAKSACPRAAASRR